MSLESFEDEEKEGVICFSIETQFHQHAKENVRKREKFSWVELQEKWGKKKGFNVGWVLLNEWVVGPNGPKNLEGLKLLFVGLG